MTRKASAGRRTADLPLHLSLILILLFPAACTRGTPPPEWVEEGVSWELAEYRRRTLDDLEYEVHLTIPEKKEDPIPATLLARFRWEDLERRPVVFDFLDPVDRVEEVRLNGSPIGYRPVNDHLVLEIPQNVPPGPLEIAIDFNAGDQSLNRSEDFLYALFVPDRARYSVPLFDQPNLKARFAVSLDIPVEWTAMANGPQIMEQVEGGRRRLRFAPSDPLPTYLFTFVAGRFERVVGRRGERVMEFLHRETDREKVDRNLEDLFDLHETALAWLEDYTGIPYPFQKIGFVAVPSFQYGGMEHPGAVFYRDENLFLEPSATQSQYLGRASLVAHETAHMWFGDLVTMDWFDDVWTKEVFANFMAAKIVHPSFPQLNHDLRFLLAHHPQAYAVDRTDGANPIRQPLENLREAGTLYGPIIYQKAPVVMRQLELLLGADAFREGIQEYLRTYAFGNASWPALIEILDRGSPEDLEGWSQMWVQEPDRPRVWVDWAVGPDGTLASMTLRQADPRGAGRVWPQRISVGLGYGGALKRFPVRLAGQAVEIEAAVGMEAPDFVIPGAWGEGYGLFLLDEASRSHLLQHLPRVRDATVRGAGWLALWDGLLEGAVEPSAFLDLSLRALGEEEEEQIVQRILETVETVYWTLLPDSDRGPWAERIEGELWDGVSRARSPSLKSSFFRAFRDVASSSSALGVLEEIWRGDRQVQDLPLAEPDRIALSSALALRGVRGWEDILDRQLVRIENPDRRAEFEFVRPSLDEDPSVREAFFRELGDAAHREKEPWVLAGLRNLHHPLRRQHSLRFIRPSLELLEEVQRTGDIFFPARWLTATLQSHNSREAADSVRVFLDARPDYPLQLRRKILQAADPVFRANEILRGGGS